MASSIKTNTNKLTLPSIIDYTLNTKETKYYLEIWAKIDGNMVSIRLSLGLLI